MFLQLIAMSTGLPIRLFPELFGMIKLPADAVDPLAGRRVAPCFIARTSEELSIVAALEVVEAIGTSAGRFRLFRIDQVFGTTETGVFRRVVDPLADAGVWILPLGTHDTDYFLVREDQCEVARRALLGAKHRVIDR